MGEEDDHDEASPRIPLSRWFRKLAEGERILNGGGDLASVLRTLKISESTGNTGDRGDRLGLDALAVSGAILGPLVRSRDHAGGFGINEGLKA